MLAAGSVILPHREMLVQMWIGLPEGPIMLYHNYGQQRASRVGAAGRAACGLGVPRIVMVNRPRSWALSPRAGFWGIAVGLGRPDRGFLVFRITVLHEIAWGSPKPWRILLLRPSRKGLPEISRFHVSTPRICMDGLFFA